MCADESLRRGAPSGGKTRGARARDGAKTAPRRPVMFVRVFARFARVEVKTDLRSPGARES